MCRWLVVVFCLCLSVPAYAQTVTLPSAIVLRVYPAGSTVPIGGPMSLPAANALCDLAPATTGTNINPTRWRWTDPARPPRECEFPDAARLDNLSDGSYVGTIQFTFADGTSSVEHAPVPFERRRPLPKAVPTGLRIIN